MSAAPDTRQSDDGGQSRRARGNRRMGLALAGVVAGMVGLSFAAVPLYSLFCQVTGYGGTTQVADQVPDAPLERSIKVRFNADINPALPWRFQPEQREVEVKIGEPTLVFYSAHNLSARETHGTAVFNVTPLKAGAYFQKVACFCFSQQTLKPGERVEMGVSFYVDPSLVDDPSMDSVETITLSYTFFQDLDDLPLQDEGEAVGQGEGAADATQTAQRN
ncbi:MAG: cytochrome c oxidase assembly protein [Rhodovibrionaceae bacterium]